MSILTWLAGPYIDITPDPDTMAMLEQPAACDKQHVESIMVNSGTAVELYTEPPWKVAA